jgi:hypothetical protein
MWLVGLLPTSVTYTAEWWPLPSLLAALPLLRMPACGWCMGGGRVL